MTDADRIAEIHVAAWRAAYRGIVPDAYLAAMSVEQRAARWRTIIEATPGSVLACEHDGRIVGWVSIGPGRDDDAETDGEIYALYVDPDFWRGGTGRELMARAEQELRSRGFIQLFLWVLEQNARARRFYESAGYSLDAQTKSITIGEAQLLELRYEKQA